MKHFPRWKQYHVDMQIIMKTLKFVWAKFCRILIRRHLIEFTCTYWWWCLKNTHTHTWGWRLKPSGAERRRIERNNFKLRPHSSQVFTCVDLRIKSQVKKLLSGILEYGVSFEFACDGSIKKYTNRNACGPRILSVPLRIIGFFVHR